MYTLVSRKGCHLCEEAEQLLSEQGILFEWKDVDASDELKQQFTFRVPVLLEQDRVIIEGKFTPERLARRLDPHER